MNLFGKKPQHVPTNEEIPYGDDPADLQAMAQNIATAFTDHDTKALAVLTPEQRAAQAEARWQLYRHIDKIWDADHLRSQGIHPVEAGGYESVAGLRDLVMDLIGNIDTAQETAGDDVDRISANIVVTVEPGDD
ncbi:hypothetical protein ACWKSP_22070 [Micromonosporaceae bacterium Da 78-11]